MRRLLLAAAVCTISARAEAGRGAFLPPLEIEYGGVAILGDADHAPATATELLVGASWASLDPRPTPVDVSIGVIVTLPHVAPAANVARGEVTMATPDTAFGGFVDVGIRVDQRAHVRTWLGGRAELLGDGERGVLGAALRASVELWTPAVAGGHGGGILGTVAIAVWSECGVRERSDGALATRLAAGLGVRLPFVAAY